MHRTKGGVRAPRSIGKLLARALHNINPLAAAAAAGVSASEAVDRSPAWKARPASMAPATWRAAKLLSLCGNPFVISVPTFAATSLRSARRWPERLRWWGIATAAMTLPALVYVRYGVRTGRLSDHEVTVRQERFWPYVFEIAAVAGAYGLMRALRAPRQMSALVVSVAAAMMTITGVTLVWKMSMHVVGTAGAATVLVLLYGKRATPALALVPLVGWSRYVLEHHTIAQIVAGGLVGAASPVIVFRRMGLTGNGHPSTPE